MIFGIDLEGNVWSWRLSKLLFEVKRTAVYKLLKWFEFGEIPSGASARSPGVEILDFSSALVTLVPQLEVLMKPA